MTCGTALARAWRDGAFGSLAETYLHRASREDALGLIVGRDAIIAELIATAAAFDRPDVVVHHDGNSFCSVEIAGPFRGGLLGLEAGTTDAPARLRQHRWLRREGDYVAEETVVADYLPLIDAAGASRNDIARSVGGASPTQPPLGELRSGQGQLAVGPSALDDPILDAVHAIWNGRHFNRIAALYAADARWQGPAGRTGGTADLRAWLCQLVARLPDATFVIDRTEVIEGGLALLWRLFGHAGGRRVRLIGSSILGLAGGRIVADETLVDELALLATPYRPLLTL